MTAFVCLFYMNVASSSYATRLYSNMGNYIKSYGTRQKQTFFSLKKKGNRL